MAEVQVPFFADGTPATVVIDGVTYRVAVVNADGRLVVALDLGALTPPTTLDNNQRTVTTAGARVQLQTQACLGVTVKAKSANTGLIYVGDSGVTSANGHILAAGDAVSLAIDNVNRLWIDASVDGEGVSWLAVGA